VSSPLPVSASIYVRILNDIENFGIHDFWAVPRVGETIRLNRSDADHTITVRSVEHNLGPFGHSVRLICD